MRRRWVAMVALVALVVTACQPPTHLNTVSAEVEAKVRAACEGAAYRNCVRDALEVAITLPAGTLLLICDLGGGNGTVATTITRDSADRDCSEGGTIPNTKVIAVILVG